MRFVISVNFTFVLKDCDFCCDTRILFLVFYSTFHQAKKNIKIIWFVVQGQERTCYASTKTSDKALVMNLG